MRILAVDDEKLMLERLMRCITEAAPEAEVISFQKAEGFEKLEYPTHDEMFAFEIEKGSGGFAIQ